MVRFLLCCAFGGLAGVLSGFLGIGGGAILSPLLVFAFGMEQHQAQGISLAALLPPVGLPAVLSYRRQGVAIDRRLVATLLAGFLVGVSGGAWGAHRVAPTLLRGLFACFLVVSSLRALRLSMAETVREEPPPSHSPKGTTGFAIGLAAGLLSGLLGVGGGIVTLPLLQRFAGLRRLEAQATTLAMMLPPIGLPAVYVYAQEQGGLPWSLLGAVALGFSAGGAVGALFAGRTSHRSSQRVFGIFLAIVAGLLLARR